MPHSFCFIIALFYYHVIPRSTFMWIFRSLKASILTSPVMTPVMVMQRHRDSASTDYAIYGNNKLERISKHRTNAAAFMGRKSCARSSSANVLSCGGSPFRRASP